MLPLSKIFTVPGSSDRLSAMEGLRAYAVLIVFLVHYAGLLGIHFGIDLDLFKPVAASGVKQWFLNYLHSSHYGVDIFFLISGFLISGLVVKPNFNYFTFLAHRVLRIYPAFVVSLLIYLAYGITFGHEHFQLAVLLGNILLLNGVPELEFPAISLVTWSLFFEFSFYIIMPLLFRLSARQGQQGQINLWKVSFLMMLILIPLLVIDDFYMRYFMFLAGIWLRLLPREWLLSLTKMIPEYGVIALYLCATSVFLFNKDYIIFIPLYILPCFALVNCTLNGQGALNRIFSLPPLRFMGNISFSFYLYHSLGLMMAGGILNLLNVTSFGIYAIGYLALGLIIALALSITSYWLFERPYFSQKARFDMMLRKLRLMPAAIS